MGEDLKKFDLRLVERHIEKGIISREEYEAYLKGLKDSQSKSVAMSPVQPISEKA